MICYWSSSPSTKQVQMTKELEPWPTFSCWWFNGFEITVHKVIEMLFFKVRWKSIFKWFKMLFFLLKSQDNLQGKIGVKLNCFISLLIAVWRPQLQQLGQSQSLMELLLLCLKNFLSSQEIVAELAWYGWGKESKILLAAWIESVIKMMWLMLNCWVAWFIPYCKVKISTSVEVILTAWWIILMTGLLYVWTCAIEVVTLFLMLASKTTMVVYESDNDWRETLSRLCKWLLTLFLLFLSKEWKENLFGKMSISLFPSKNLWSKGEKEGMILLNLLSMSTIEPLIFRHCLCISPSNERQWVLALIEGLVSNNNLMIWFDGKECVLSWNLPFSFWIWRWMEISPAIASIPKVGVV